MIVVRGMWSGWLCIKLDLFFALYKFVAHHSNKYFEDIVRACINFPISDITLVHCELLLVLYLGI